MNVLVLTFQPQVRLGIIEGLRELGHKVIDVFLGDFFESQKEDTLVEIIRRENIDMVFTRGWWPTQITPDVMERVRQRVKFSRLRYHDQH